MCKIWDEIKKDGIEEGKKEGLKEGIHVGKIEIAQALYQAGILTVEQIEKFTGVGRIEFVTQPA